MSPTPTIVPVDRKLDGLHGLRAVAAMAVVLFHVHHLTGFPMPAVMAPVATHFGLSVHLFFALSAFSLAHSSRVAPSGLAAYLAKRFFRIAPLFYLTLAYYAWRTSPPFSELAANVTFVFNFIPRLQESVVSAGWTVGVEMPFYALLPLLLWLRRDLGAQVAVFVAAAAVSVATWKLTYGAPGLPPRYAYFSLPGNLVHFAGGLLAYGVFVALRGRSSRARSALLGLGFFAGLVLAYWDPAGLEARHDGLYYILWALIFGLLCVWQALHPSRILRTRAAQWLADRSFSLYLLHPLIITLLYNVYRKIGAHTVKEGGPSYFVSLALTLVLLLVLSDISHRAVELPSIAYGRKWAARLESRVESRVTAPGASR